jgi:hypothetical protein
VFQIEVNLVGFPVSSLSASYVKMIQTGRVEEYKTKIRLVRGLLPSFTALV